MVDIVAARKLVGTVSGVYAAFNNGFETQALERLYLRFAGIEGDRHAGLTRKSGPREPWYPRGSLIANERQLSIVGEDDLADIATALGLQTIAPEWLGANIVLHGVPRVSLLPSRTILMFEGGASVRIDGENTPCRKTGRAIAGHVESRADIEFGFVKAARYRRGVVGWVEREGVVVPGESVTVRLWEQWIYPPAQGELGL